MDSHSTSRYVLILAAASAGAGLVCGCASHADTRPEAQASQGTQTWSAEDERAYRQYLSQQATSLSGFLAARTGAAERLLALAQPQHAAQRELASQALFEQRLVAGQQPLDKSAIRLRHACLALATRLEAG